MRTYFDCIPCFIRQVIDSLRVITGDEAIHEQVLRRVLDLASEMDLRQSPPAMAQKIHRIIRQLTEIDDPYKEVKTRFNAFALELYPGLQKLVMESEDPFETAVRLAIAGNIIDLGVKSSLGIPEVERSIKESLTVPFDTTNMDEFKNASVEAHNILYIGDNSGEIVFDRFLIEQIGPERITFVVRGRPVINDATIEDAHAAGLMDLVKVIDSGDDAPGTILESCSEEFRIHFEQSDMVIAKGQGNFESLSDIDKNIFFLLRAKCPVIANHLDCKIGEMILHKSKLLNHVVELAKEAE
ncbi:MAG: DUF89 family protein [Planctomycetes bacterium]|nr:DUF89 family protein [Planctomycetota bacterium]